MLKSAAMMNGRCISGSKVKYMSPSSIHYIHPDTCFGLTGSTSPSTGEDGLLSSSGGGGGTCLQQLERTVAELAAVGLSKVRHLKVQIVEKDGHWFALNSAQLGLCRRLEKDGLCAKVRVDVVPSREVPLNVRNLMTLPPVYVETTVKPKPKEDATTDERAVSPGNRFGETLVGGRNGYQQLYQEEQEQEIDRQEQEQEGVRRRRSDASNNGSDDDDEDSDEYDTEEECSAHDVFSDSDVVGWSGEELGSSDEEWSNGEGGEGGGGEDEGGGGVEAADFSSDAEELASEDDDDENDCLL